MLRLLLLLCLSAVRALNRTTPCDVFLGAKGEELCGPSILIIGAGKCGTNKVSRHIAHYYADKVRTTVDSEVVFDPCVSSSTQNDLFLGTW